MQNVWGVLGQVQGRVGCSDLRVLMCLCTTLSSHIVIIIPNHPPSIRCQEDVIVLWTVMMAGAGLDEHHLLGEDVSLWTLELYLCCYGGVRRAAAIICADTTELWFVQPGAGTARQLEAHPLLDFWCPDTFLPLLWDRNYNQ